LCNPCRAVGDSAETEGRGYESKDQENQCVMQHGRLLSTVRMLINSAFAVGEGECRRGIIGDGDELMIKLCDESPRCGSKCLSAQTAEVRAVEETRELHLDKDGTLTYADAFEMLQDDHKRMREYFQEYEKAEDNTVKRRIAQDALLELEVHTALEEELIYPAMRAQDTSATDQAVENHHVIKILIGELKKMIPGDSHFDAKFRVLAQIAVRHFDEEEEEILPEAADQLLDLHRLGDQMSLLRQRLVEQARITF
jgi:hypothetical protein